MNRLFPGAVVASGVATTCLIPSRPANARLQYFKEFETQNDFRAPAVVAEKCAVCHRGVKGANKKLLTRYGEEVNQRMKGKNVKNPAAVEKAIRDAENGDAGDGKTFGQLLKEGKLK